MRSKIALMLVSLTLVGTASADVVCGKVTAKLKNGKVKPKLSTQTLAGSVCPKGFTPIVDTAALVATVQGPAGPQGIPGNDGTPGRNIYGDGSAGAQIQASSTTLDLDNLQFTDFTVNSGVTLNVPSGTVIRCTGTFTNNGTINVQTFAAGSGSNMGGQLATSDQPAHRGAHPGIGRSAAGDSEYGDISAPRVGGEIGAGVSNEIAARALLIPGPIGGGGGGTRKNGFAGNGGGTFSVLCDGGIVNNGVIRANGTSGSGSGTGGGGGGLVILASSSFVQIDSNGFIEAKGGNGNALNASIGGAGGGGGGGLIRLIAPSISVPVPGNLSVAGGTAGNNSGTVTTTPRSGGGAGGGSIGNGGLGATVDTNGTAATSPAQPGSPGLILTDLADAKTLL